MTRQDKLRTMLTSLEAAKAILENQISVIHQLLEVPEEEVPARPKGESAAAE